LGLFANHRDTEAQSVYGYASGGCVIHRSLFSN
jgi:hypothetical protein